MLQFQPPRESLLNALFSLGSRIVTQNPFGSRLDEIFFKIDFHFPWK